LDLGSDFEPLIRFRKILFRENWGTVSIFLRTALVRGFSTYSKKQSSNPGGASSKSGKIWSISPNARTVVVLKPVNPRLGLDKTRESKFPK
jgi:hypothetical protein